MERNLKNNLVLFVFQAAMCKLINDKTQTCENFMSESSQNSVGSKFNYVVFILCSYLCGLFWNVGVSGLGCSKFKMFWFDSILDFKSSIPMCSEDIVLLFFFPLQNFFVRQIVIQSRNLILKKNPTSAKIISSNSQSNFWQ